MEISDVVHSGFYFNIIVISQINVNQINITDGSLNVDIRASKWNAAYPEAFIWPIEYELFHNLKECCADFLNCKSCKNRHQCFPGPILRNVEAFAKELIRISHIQSVT